MKKNPLFEKFKKCLSNVAPEVREEVRLNMDSDSADELLSYRIEEKAKDYAGYNRQPSPDIITEIIMSNIRDGFKAGAEWMLSKAVDWLSKHGDEGQYCDSIDGYEHIQLDLLIEDFQKAMDE